jgi:murein DD-endopeptidase MepM/ murein hydrolase activator NlpD
MLITKREQSKSLGKEIFKLKNFRLVRISFLDYHYFFANQKKIIQGQISFRTSQFRLIPLFLTSFTITFFLGFGMETTGIRIDASQANLESEAIEEVVTETNEEEDRKAKLGDDKFLDDTEEQKWAILRAEELELIDSEKKKKLTVTAYRVKSNETLSEIASRFKVSIDSIAGSSAINPEDPIRPGQVLQIPNKQGLLYKFKKGDTLAKVADFYKVKIESVLAENGNLDYDFIRVGQKMFLPGAVIPEPKPKWVSPAQSRLITSGYGWRTFPKKKYHKALDFRANYEPVKAARKGQVIFAGWMGGYGNMVVIQHDNEYKTLYAHNSKLFVKKGTYVQAGQTIARSGCTGYCFGPHIHFELIHKGNNINPTKVIKGLSYK